MRTETGVFWLLRGVQGLAAVSPAFLTRGLNNLGVTVVVQGTPGVDPAFLRRGLNNLGDTGEVPFCC